MTYRDYTPPAGPHAIVAGELLPATAEPVAGALALNAMFLSVGNPAFVAEQFATANESTVVQLA